MRLSVLLMIALATGCATQGDEPGPIVIDRDDMPTDMKSDDGNTIDVCGLAAQLPEGDICRHVCDPDAMAAQLIAEGSDRGACYQLYCALPEDHHVLAGVCIPE